MILRKLSLTLCQSNKCKKKLVEQRYNYLDGPIHSMAKIFETRIENLEKSIPHVFPQETGRKTRKALGKGNKWLLEILLTRIRRTITSARSFVSTMARADIPRMSVVRQKKVQQIWGECHCAKTHQESQEKGKKACWGATYIWKMSVSDSDKEFICISSRKEDEVW